MTQPTKTMPSKAQFDEIKDQLSSAFNPSVYLLIDGYYILAAVVQYGMTLKIVVHVNGWLKGKWIWIGRRSELASMPEISRKFYRLKSGNVYNAKQIKAWEKHYRSKANAKANGIYDKIYSTDPCFLSASGFINHIKKNNDSIQWLSSDEYYAGLKALESRDAINRVSTGECHVD